MEKEVRTARNVYLIVDFIIVASWFCYVFTSQFNSVNGIIGVITTLSMPAFIYYGIDLAGVNTTILLLIAGQSIKDFRKTGDKQALAITSLLMAGNLMMNIYVRIQMPFEIAPW